MRDERLILRNTAQYAEGIFLMILKILSEGERAGLRGFAQNSILKIIESTS